MSGLWDDLTPPLHHFMPKKKFKLRECKCGEYGVPLSGGFRVRECALIEVLEDSIILQGIHNNEVWKDKVPKGYVFNSNASNYWWSDVIPIYERKDGIYYKVVGKCLPWQEVDEINKKNNIKAKRIWEKTDNHYH